MIDEFSRNDVLAMANVILEGFVGYEHSEYINDIDGYFCVHCESEKVGNSEDVTHELDCIVKVAQDVLTRN